MWNVAVTHTRTTMITQVLVPVFLSHLYHSCALKSVWKAFFFFVYLYGLPSTGRDFTMKFCWAWRILPPPKATALSLTSVEVRLFLKSPGKEKSSQGGTAPLHHSGTACRGRKHSQTHFPMEKSSFFVYVIILQMGKMKDLWICVP